MKLHGVIILCCGLFVIGSGLSAEADELPSSFGLYTETLGFATSPESHHCKIGSNRAGHATWYEANGLGNCSFDRLSDDMLVAALNKADYGLAEWCGTCAEITGPQGVVTVKIADRCPECGPGDLDLSSAAFSKIAGLDQGRVDISWQFVACDDHQEMSLHFKSDSDRHWAAVQVRNHQLPIAALEYQDKSGRFKQLKRKRYNFFVKPGGVGNKPVTFRVTDHFGQQLIVRNLRFLPGKDQPTGQQFEACPH